MKIENIEEARKEVLSKMLSVVDKKLQYDLDQDNEVGAMDWYDLEVTMLKEFIGIK